MSHLVHTGSVDMPNAAAQRAAYNGFQASSTCFECPQADDRQLYLIIELYRPYRAVVLAHQGQRSSSCAAALRLDGHTLISLTL